MESRTANKSCSFLFYEIHRSKQQVAEIKLVTKPKPVKARVYKKEFHFLNFVCTFNLTANVRILDITGLFKKQVFF